MEYHVTGRNIRIEFELVEDDRQAEPNRDDPELTSRLCEAAAGIEAEPWAWALGQAGLLEPAGRKSPA